MWHALVTLLGIPGRCDFVWHDCAGGVAMLGGGAGAIELDCWINVLVLGCTCCPVNRPLTLPANFTRTCFS